MVTLDLVCVWPNAVPFQTARHIFFNAGMLDDRFFTIRPHFLDLSKIFSGLTDGESTNFMYAQVRPRQELRSGTAPTSSYRCKRAPSTEDYANVRLHRVQPFQDVESRLDTWRGRSIDADFCQFFASVQDNNDWFRKLVEAVYKKRKLVIDRIHHCLE